MGIQKRDPSHVAIVGCGFTGTTALCQLVRHYPVRRITIFESSGDFGPGFPYRVDESREYLLNNTNDTMCLEPANRRAFVEWLHGHADHAVGLDEKASMPRAVYGEFLKCSIRRAVSDAASRGIAVKFVAEEVIDLDEKAGGGVSLQTASGSFLADVVILSTGRCPDVEPYDLPGAPDRNYFPLHIPGAELDTLPIDAECYVLGASLSAYDVVNQLFAPSTGCRFVADGQNRLRFEPNGNLRRVVLCSRSGRLKKVQSRRPFRVRPEYFSLAALQNHGRCDKKSRVTLRVTLRQVLELLEKDAANHGVRIDRRQLAEPYAGCGTAAQVNRRARDILEQDIDAAASGADSTANFIVDYLDAAQMEFWDVFAAHALAPEQEALFRLTYESALLSYAAPCPALTAKKILALMQGRQLHIVQGVNAVNISGKIRIDHRFGTDYAPYLINASGAVDRAVTSGRQSRLISNLQRKGILRAYARAKDISNGIDVDLQTFQSAGSARVLVANMFLWGPGLYVSSAIMMATIVERLLRNLFDGSLR